MLFLFAGIEPSFLQNRLNPLLNNGKELGGRIGEIDLSTSDYIIECYPSVGGKSKQMGDFDKYFAGDRKQAYINPNNKGVILYSPNGIDPKKAENIQSKGVKIITTEEDLIKTLKGNK